VLIRVDKGHIDVDKYLVIINNKGCNSEATYFLEVFNRMVTTNPQLNVKETIWIKAII
jgi:hypothetical protein